MTFTIRRPRPDDASAIADLHVATWKETYTHLLPENYFSEDYVQRRHLMWNHVLTHPREDISVRVAESDGRIIGFAWLGPGEGQDVGDAPRERLLYAIYVLAAHHSTGAGQALLDETLGNDQAMLWVAKENPRAIAFYLRNGFDFDGVEKTDPSAPLITEARMLR